MIDLLVAQEVVLLLVLEVTLVLEVVQMLVEGASVGEVVDGDGLLGASKVWLGI